MDQPAPEALSQARADWLYDKQHRLTCRVELSATYHAKRERFLTVCERFCQATAALTATAAFSQLLGPEWPLAGRWFALVAAVASVLPLVFAWSSRANQHATLAADHRRLLARIVSAGYELTEKQLLAFSGELREIEATEGASLGALVIQCQNEMAMAAGHPEFVQPLSWLQRLTMHVWDWEFHTPAAPKA